jgi:hypothetical protein
LGLRGSGWFLERRVCSLGVLALAFQAQFDEGLPKLAVVHDSSLQREELQKLLHAPGFYWAPAKPQKAIVPITVLEKLVLARGLFLLSTRKGHKNIELLVDEQIP